VFTVLFQAETNFARPPQCEDGEGLDAADFPALQASVSHPSWLMSMGFGGWYDR
jgi:hypothetical protein